MKLRWGQVSQSMEPDLMTKEVWNIPLDTIFIILIINIAEEKFSERRRETEKESEREISVKVCQLMRRGKGQ